MVNSSSVSQQRRGSDFTLHELHELVTAANKLGLPDETVMICTGSRMTSRIFSLSTSTPREPSPAEFSPVAPPSPLKTADTPSGTAVRQAPTGNEITVTHWFARHVTKELTLGDLRSLLARIDELALNATQYHLQAHYVPGSRGQGVYSIEAVPPRSSADPALQEIVDMTNKPGSPG
ncbi:hypothetical protein AB0H34_18335 [Saccharopolyspora shandongensis]|uniref:hypothetical protein n=1 Tax=Saccharopolyspora shandongensis TaxID=418495 RepID=UPI0033CE8407